MGIFNSIIWRDDKTTKMSRHESHLDIIIVGAGLSGLATAICCTMSGHTVIVLEQAKELAEVGAGLQITPNASRLFSHWKLPEKLWKDAAEPTSLTVHRYTGEVLAHEASFDRNIRSKYSAPFIDLHRVDLQQALYARAKELGVTFHLDERVDSINFDTTTVTTLKGKTISGDLIVAADGLWSRCRECLGGKKDDPIPTGDLAYRIVLTADQISDPDLKAWVENPTVHFWIGPGAHAVGYSLRGGKMLNIVLLVPDDLPPGVSRQAGSQEEMMRLFVGWDPILTRFLGYVNGVDKWKLMHHAEMESWINDKSNLVFIGDACHPMLPYLAQGANSSLEDGAVLGSLLGHMKKKSDLPDILRLYEKLRKSRGEAIVRETFKQRNDFHMPNGPEQEKRDQIFLSQLGKELKGAFPSRWTCPEVQPWLYGYDAIKEVENVVVQNPGLFGSKKTSHLYLNGVGLKSWLMGRAE
ncbi:FAD binding domain protein [Aspergillus sclerotioniger CBS 115572]|uniref:FAD binding domain protein n=1 Tax=Aspergillus sclerotioniger CBS 115572 TaxID=1450535 RepID=A0A317WZH3_9EURO|nr:FAD binding domain protein [Aspergillus sclerotioniger CBS 115572]PWY91381.1 FAD binding domain protein [Aspergillus sclerotioniger CBS 115572]